MNLLLGLTNIFCALLGIGLAIPLLRGKIPRNPLYGVRFRTSFASDELWYAINRYGARRMLVWSGVLLAIGVLAFFVPMHSDVVVLLFALAPLLYLVPCIETYRYAQRL